MNNEIEIKFNFLLIEFHRITPKAIPIVLIIGTTQMFPVAHKTPPATGIPWINPKQEIVKSILMRIDHDISSKIKNI